MSGWFKKVQNCVLRVPHNRLASFNSERAAEVNLYVVISEETNEALRVRPVHQRQVIRCDQTHRFDLPIPRPISPRFPLCVPRRDCPRADRSTMLVRLVRVFESRSEWM